MSVETAIKNATASLEMEGMTVSDELKELCVKKINKEITMDEYIKLAMALKGVRM
ncbi:antitoxin VbhA family protein [Eubacterium sp.]